MVVFIVLLSVLVYLVFVEEVKVEEAVDHPKSLRKDQQAHKSRHLEPREAIEVHLSILKLGTKWKDLLSWCTNLLCTESSDVQGIGSNIELIIHLLKQPFNESQKWSKNI